jgi:segregation and condensation protein B
MDDIMRDAPADAGSVRSRSERIKGPEELVLLARGVAAEDLVVDAPRIPDEGEPSPEPEVSPQSVPQDSEPAAQQETLAPLADDEEAASPEIAAELDAFAQAPVEAPVEPVEPVESVESGEPAAPLGATEVAQVAPGIAEGAIGESEIDAAAAAAAVAAEADTVEIDEASAGDAEDGLPPVPELTDPAAASRILFVLMLTTREGLSLFRLAQACNSTQKVVEQALQILQQDLVAQGLPLELARTGDSFKLISQASVYPYLTRLRGVKKLEKLSPAALETLAVIAYKQPVMRAEIESIRGVKAGPMLRTLLQHKLVRVTGRADVPGRPLQYGTTQQFLERFGLASLQDLPSQREFKQIH